MSIPLRMLLIRIPDEVTGRILDELRRGGFDPHYQSADTLDDLERMLPEHWDVLIVDVRWNTGVRLNAAPVPVPANAIKLNVHRLARVCLSRLSACCT